MSIHSALPLGGLLLFLRGQPGGKHIQGLVNLFVGFLVVFFLPGDLDHELLHGLLAGELFEAGIHGLEYGGAL